MNKIKIDPLEDDYIIRRLFQFLGEYRSYIVARHDETNINYQSIVPRIDEFVDACSPRYMYNNGDIEKI